MCVCVCVCNNYIHDLRQSKSESFGLFFLLNITSQNFVFMVPSALFLKFSLLQLLRLMMADYQHYTPKSSIYLFIRF